MASLTITVPDAVVPRILAALGAATAADVTTWIKQQVKQQVASYEATQIVIKGQSDSQQKLQAVAQEQW
jgi:hypothetical protein